MCRETRTQRRQRGGEQRRTGSEQAACEREHAEQQPCGDRQHRQARQLRDAQRVVAAQEEEVAPVGSARIHGVEAARVVDGRLPDLEAEQRQRAELRQQRRMVGVEPVVAVHEVEVARGDVARLVVGERLVVARDAPPPAGRRTRRAAQQRCEAIQTRGAGPDGSCGHRMTSLAAGGGAVSLARMAPESRSIAGLFGSSSRADSSCSLAFSRSPARR